MLRAAEVPGPGAYEVSPLPLPKMPSPKRKGKQGNRKNAGSILAVGKECGSFGARNPSIELCTLLSRRNDASSGICSSKVGQPSLVERERKGRKKRKKLIVRLLQRLESGSDSSRLGSMDLSVTGVCVDAVQQLYR